MLLFIAGFMIPVASLLQLFGSSNSGSHLKLPFLARRQFEEGKTFNNNNQKKISNQIKTLKEIANAYRNHHPGTSGTICFISKWLLEERFDMTPPQTPRSASARCG